MTRHVLALTAALIFVTCTLPIAGQTTEAKPAAKPTQALKCPVDAKPANLLLSIATDDGPVFVCSEACSETYKKAPGDFAAKAADQRKALADRPKVQVTCPVDGKPADKKVSTDEAGKKVLFCSEACADKYKADPGKYKSALANSYSYQLKCAVMGGDIDPAVFMDLTNGRRVYFCCPACAEPLTKEPDKYLPKLAEQGIIVDPKTFPKKETKDAKEPKEGAADHHH